MSAAEAAARTTCAAPAEYRRFRNALPHLSQALNRGEAVRIVALGSSSTQGAGASSKSARYPARLQAELERRFPGQRIEVANLGVGGELASDMVARIESQVTGHGPQLVIWQTGVNDALRGVPLGDFHAEVLRGLSLMRSRGYDVVLLDQQYFPRSRTLPAYGRYVAALKDIAREEKVALLRRYEIMRHLADSSEAAVAALLAADRFHQNDAGYRCLGTLMADALEASVRTGSARGQAKAAAASATGSSAH